MPNGGSYVGKSVRKFKRRVEGWTLVHKKAFKELLGSEYLNDKSITLLRKLQKEENPSPDQMTLLMAMYSETMHKPRTTRAIKGWDAWEEDNPRPTKRSTAGKSTKKRRLSKPDPDEDEDDDDDEEAGELFDDADNGDDEDDEE